MDPIISNLKKSYIRTKNRNFIPTLLMYPFTDLVKTFKKWEGLKSINLSAIPLFSFLGVTGTSYLALPEFQHMNLLLGGLSAIGVYFAILPMYLWKMTTLDNEEYFHVGAYRFLRRKECEMFEKSFLQHDFSFEGLYDFVNRTFISESDLQEKIEKALQYLIDMHKVEIRAYAEKEKEHLELVAYLEEALNLEHEESIKAEQGIEDLVELIKRITNIIFRMKNNHFRVSDLNLISGFTLYQLEGDKLRKLADEGTSGSSPEIIPLQDETYADWACVKVIKEEGNTPMYNDPYSNYSVISYKMNIDTDLYWIYNFHIDHQTNGSALELTIDNDIIDTSIIFRIIEALCLQLYQRGIGGIVHDNKKSS